MLRPREQTLSDWGLRWPRLPNKNLFNLPSDGQTGRNGDPQTSGLADRQTERGIDRPQIFSSGPGRQDQTTERVCEREEIEKEREVDYKIDYH